MSIQKLFSAALGTTLLLCFAIVATIFYRSAVRQAEHETKREARVILAAATAARDYSAQHVTPLIDADGAFHPEVVPAFAVESIMRDFSNRFPAYGYSERALNPTNQDDRARAWQVDVIEAFRAQPELRELSGRHEEKGQTLLYIAEPIRITDRTCLACHGDPKDAPKAMLAAYNSLNGFGWKMGEVVGARFVTAPFSDWLDRVLGNVLWFLIALGSVLIVALTVATAVVHRAIAKHARRLSVQAERLSLGDPDAPELDENGPAEFRRLAAAINRLHRSLRLALGDLRATGE